MKKSGISIWAYGSLAIAGLLMACGGGSEKKVYFGNLADGAQVESPIKVLMKAENLIVEPAALGVNEGHGHFHIIIDGPIASPSEPMVKDGSHIHYGNGQTEAMVDLPLGQHTLILQFAKGNHVPYDPPVYQQVQITVTKVNVVDTTAKAMDSSSVKAVDSLSMNKMDSTASKIADTTISKDQKK